MGEVDLEGQTLVEIGKGALAAGGWEPKLFLCLRMLFGVLTNHRLLSSSQVCITRTWSMWTWSALCRDWRGYSGTLTSLAGLAAHQPTHEHKKSIVCSIWNQSLQEYCKKEEGGRFKPVPAFTGHGIGTYFHGPPGELLRHTDFHFQLLLTKKFAIPKIWIYLRKAPWKLCTSMARLFPPNFALCQFTNL